MKIDPNSRSSTPPPSSPPRKTKAREQVEDAITGEPATKTQKAAREKLTSSRDSSSPTPARKFKTSVPLSPRSNSITREGTTVLSPRKHEKINSMQVAPRAWKKVDSETKASVIRQELQVHYRQLAKEFRASHDVVGASQRIRENTDSLTALIQVAYDKKILYFSNDNGEKVSILEMLDKATEELNKTFKDGVPAANSNSLKLRELKKTLQSKLDAKFLDKTLVLQKTVRAPLEERLNADIQIVKAKYQTEVAELEALDKYKHLQGKTTKEKRLKDKDFRKEWVAIDDRKDEEVSALKLKKQLQEWFCTMYEKGDQTNKENAEIVSPKALLFSFLHFTNVENILEEALNALHYLDELKKEHPDLKLSEQQQSILLFIKNLVVTGHYRTELKTPGAQRHLKALAAYAERFGKSNIAESIQKAIKPEVKVKAKKTQAVKKTEASENELPSVYPPISKFLATKDSTKRQAILKPLADDLRFLQSKSLSTIRIPELFANPEKQIEMDGAPNWNHYMNLQKGLTRFVSNLIQKGLPDDSERSNSSQKLEKQNKFVEFFVDLGLLCFANNDQQSAIAIAQGIVVALGSEQKAARIAKKYPKGDERNLVKAFLKLWKGSNVPKTKYAPEQLPLFAAGSISHSIHMDRSSLSRTEKINSVNRIVQAVLSSQNAWKSESAKAIKPTSNFGAVLNAFIDSSDSL